MRYMKERQLPSLQPSRDLEKTKLGDQIVLPEQFFTPNSRSPIEPDGQYVELYLAIIYTIIEDIQSPLPTGLGRRNRRRRRYEEALAALYCQGCASPFCIQHMFQYLNFDYETFLAKAEEIYSHINGTASLAA